MELSSDGNQLNKGDKLLTYASRREADCKKLASLFFNLLLKNKKMEDLKKEVAKGMIGAIGFILIIAAFAIIINIIAYIGGAWN